MEEIYDVNKIEELKFLKKYIEILSDPLISLYPSTSLVFQIRNTFKFPRKIYVIDLVKMKRDQILAFHGMGPLKMQELEEKLKINNLSFNMNITEENQKKIYCYAYKKEKAKC